MRNPEVAPAGNPAPRRVHVLIVQDHPLLASALARVLEGQPDLAVSGVSGSGADAVKSAALKRPDVVLMDFRPPGCDGAGGGAHDPGRARRCRHRVSQRR